MSPLRPQPQEPSKSSAVVAVAILAIFGLEALWMSLGHNGIYFTLAIVAIAGLGGYEVGKYFRRS